MILCTIEIEDIEATIEELELEKNILTNLEQESQSENKQDMLRNFLITKMKQDPDFAEKVQALIESKQMTKGDVITQNVNISGEWLNISYSGKEGWVYTEFMRLGQSISNYPIVSTSQ